MAYLNVVEVESGLIASANAYPAICELITLPYQSIEGRTCHAVRIGSSPALQKPGVLFTACAHAREWGGADICVNFVADLLEAYSSNQGLQYGGKSFTSNEIQLLVNGVNIFVFPDVNPDGRHYSQTVYTMWRKNRRPNAPVDINRNHDFMWDFKQYFHPNAPLVVSDIPSSDTYRGSAPHSEPETQNIHWLLDTYPTIAWYMDIHCYSRYVLYPWGDDANQTGTSSMNFQNPAFNLQRGLNNDNYKEYIPNNDLTIMQQGADRVKNAIQAVRGQAYRAIQSFYLDPNFSGATYPTSGTADDYVYSRHLVNGSKPRIYGFTLEFGTEFQPPWAEMERIILDVNAGMIAFCQSALPVFIPPRFVWWRWLFRWQLLREILVAVVRVIGRLIEVLGRLGGGRRG